jgi:two-component system, sensor histidine kinase
MSEHLPPTGYPMPKMSDKERFLSAAVHDLKNPLHSIVLFIAALKQSVDEPERIRYLIDRLDRSTRGLDALFKRLLDMSRLDLGKSIPVISVFDLAVLFETLEGQFAQFAERKGLCFTARLDDPLYVRADPVMTTEILINLLSNAFRYTKTGTVTLRGRKTPSGALIEVCDTGQGIPRDKVKRIFEEFSQLANENGSGSEEGLGLGLAIVRRLASAMATEVVVQSEWGRGSVFGFCLPISLIAPSKNPDAAARLALRGLLVLVIDDDVHALTAMEALLVGSGCFVLLARNLLEAEEKLESNERFPDAIISESVFKDGSDCDQIHQRLTEIVGMTLPLLVVTKASDHNTTRRIDAGAIARVNRLVVTKPAGSDEILDALCQLIANETPIQIDVQT